MKVKFQRKIEVTWIKRNLKWILKWILKLTSPVIRPQILFDSFNGKQYSDNPRAISEMMHQMYPEYKIVWYLNDDASLDLVPDYVKRVSSRMGFYRQLFSSFCYVTNCEFYDLGSLKKKKQLYIQTWHGDRGFKKVLYEAAPDLCKMVRVCDSEVVDIALSGSDFGSNQYRLAFNYSGKIQKIGCPRNERMLGMGLEERKEIRRRLGISDDSKVLLYAPTFRDDSPTTQRVNIDIGRTKRILADKYGGEWIAIVRAHVGTRLIEGTDTNGCINATDYPDATDILSITDFLISDYSSIVCDFCLTGKPTVLAIFDLADYEMRCREFKVNPTETGLLCVNNQKELEDLICNLDDRTVREAYERMNRFFGTSETGMATRRICKEIDSYYRTQYRHSHVNKISCIN